MFQCMTYFHKFLMFSGRAGNEEAGKTRSEVILSCLTVLETANAIHQSTVMDIAMCDEYKDLPMPELFHETFLND